MDVYEIHVIHYFYYLLFMSLFMSSTFYYRFATPYDID